jgi:hypothetical protein
MTRKIRHLSHFEQLEPRILLSGDGLFNIAPEPQEDTIVDNTTLVVQYVELLDRNEQVEEHINPGLVLSDIPNTDVYRPIITLLVDDDSTIDELINVDLSAENTSSALTGDILIELSHRSEEDSDCDFVTTQNGSMPIDENEADLSKEYAKSIEIRGPPLSETVNSKITNYCADSKDSEVDYNILNEYAAEMQPDGTIDLSGLYLVDPTVDYFNGQVIYLDFDGAQDVTYNGPVVVEGIDIPIFSAASAGLAGQESVIISQIVSALEQEFEGKGVLFTTTKPNSGTLYSTIFVGGDGSSFSAYGSFVGLAEKVDVGNQNPDDNAFVFSDNIVGGYTDLGLLVTRLEGLIAHETAHLLGYAHEAQSEVEGSLYSVAAIVSDSESHQSWDNQTWTSPHVQVRTGFALFTSRLSGT